MMKIKKNLSPSGLIACSLRGEEGTSLIETALLLPVLLLMMVGAVDFGRAYYAAIEVQSAAEAGALYGVQYPSDAAGMVLAAKADATDITGIAPVAIYGCECFDGTSAVASCTATPTTCGTNNFVNYAEVDTTATYTTLLRYPGIPSTIPLTGKARMRSAQ
jgi:Flp pilus assembly protein TadG